MDSARKGIVLAGGRGSRLHPLTAAISKQLLPIYNKPMIFYPLSVLMLAGIREIAVITCPHEQPKFKQLLGNGEQWGIEISFINQPSPDGIAQAYILAEDFLNNTQSALILGDNIFYGHSLTEHLLKLSIKQKGAGILGYRVNDPQAYGVISLNSDKEITALTEKPLIADSNYVATGLYFLDNTAVERAKNLTPSKRGELEIIDLLKTYLDDNMLDAEILGRGFAWLDAGTVDTLLDAGNFVRTLEMRQGQKIADLSEIAIRNKWINKTD